MATVTGDELRTAAEKVRELSGDIADTLSGWQGPGDQLTYRGTLLHELLEAALVLRKVVIAEHPADDGIGSRLLRHRSELWEAAVILFDALNSYGRQLDDLFGQNEAFNLGREKLGRAIGLIQNGVEPKE